MDRPTTPGSAASSSLSGEALVAEVYRCHSAFLDLAASRQRADLAHRLVLCESLSIGGEAPVVAAGIASAASLTIEPDADAVRHGIRSGAVDFTVNTLDEALRALKNEVRKGTSIAVCLEGDPGAMLLQMAERGVQPDVMCTSDSADPRLRVFLERGAAVIDLGLAKVADGPLATRWRVSALPGKWLPCLDEMVAAVLPDGDAVRHRWLKRAPRYLGRAMRTGRFVPLHEQEWIELQSAAAARPWDVVVTLDRGGETKTYGA